MRCVDWSMRPRRSKRICSSPASPPTAMAGITMSDGNTLFHASHGNTSAGAITAATSLPAGFEAMANQTDANGTLFLDNSPRYLVVGPKNAVTARVELQKMAFNNVSDV